MCNIFIHRIFCDPILIWTSFVILHFPRTNIHSPVMKPEILNMPIVHLKPCLVSHYKYLSIHTHARFQSWLYLYPVSNRNIHVFNKLRHLVKELRSLPLCLWTNKLLSKRILMCSFPFYLKIFLCQLLRSQKDDRKIP